MFRRIEFIKRLNAARERELLEALAKGANAFSGERVRFEKTGIMGGTNYIVDSQWTLMNAPRRALHKNCRFYFTEAGWKMYGRPTVIACQQTGQAYRIVTLKEKSVDIFYRDEIQVAVRPKKKTSRVQRSLKRS